jgi:hypothetical protein
MRWRRQEQSASDTHSVSADSPIRVVNWPLTPAPDPGCKLAHSKPPHHEDTNEAF